MLILYFHYLRQNQGVMARSYIHLIENALDRLCIYHNGKLDVSKLTWIL